VRFTRDGERLVVDLDRRRGGRGVHIGATRRCLERALKRGAFARVLRGKLDTPSPEELAEELAGAFLAHLDRAVRGGLRARQGEPVGSLSQVSPLALRELCEHVEGTPLEAAVPRVAIAAGPLASRVAWLARGASEFTFTRAGGMERRPEAPEPCVVVRGRRLPSEKA